MKNLLNQSILLIIKNFKYKLTFKKPKRGEGKLNMKEKVHMEESNITKLGIFLIILISIFMLFNQWQITKLNNLLGFTGLTVKSISSISTSEKSTVLKGAKDDLSDINLSSIKSTGHSIAALFPVENIKTTQDAIDIMIPTGTPEYGEEMGVSFDEPVKSLSLLAKANRQLQLTDEEFQRWKSIVSKPVGISCEFCCGVGPIGVDSKGNSRCGCQHNPALLALTKWLVKYRPNYSDAEIVREAMRWKTLFFPKDMVNLAMTVAGGDTSALDDLPGMVGGC
jgi:hypothetical protein